ncbi:N-formylglutamate deformylase [Undibacterium fentianense]|uniref:N-formylglutamate deformylase n=1 Tax=Undibacterium fentianense TaxID=2828728 RepID=A0A941E2F7_9BURK|nr:N-formylglutamate deformylase [Undibacterium fentianense]MBR7799766.1 N-formylglutamate deformylase [Undibacterium fentianense]
MSTSYHFHQGQVPLLISMPHVGTEIPEQIAAQMDPIAQLKADTDWHLPLLYNMRDEFGASSIQARYSRYVIDLNRPSDDMNLYPGQDTTGLCPVDTFAKQALYLEGKMPNSDEVAHRIREYWSPYHSQIQAELARMKAAHGIAILWDAHSIASHVPRFFEGKLPDLNFGTADQRSCAPSLQRLLAEHMETSATPYSHVFNGRFKGGYITRQYGQPAENIHAVQLEMSQCVYMDEDFPFSYREDLAAQIQPLLGQLLRACLSWAGQNGDRQIR